MALTHMQVSVSVCQQLNMHNDLRLLTSHPMGDFLVFAQSSISFQSRLETNARSLIHQAAFSGTRNSAVTFFAREKWPSLVSLKIVSLTDSPTNVSDRSRCIASCIRRSLAA